MSDSSAGEIRNEDETSRKRSRDDTTSVGAASSPAVATSLPPSPTGLDFATMSRSERKRHREKKRRSDVNKGFDELMSLLLEIDPDVRAEAEEKAIKGWKGAGRDGSSEDNILSRVELISKAVEVLRRVHTENEERKGIIATLMQRSTGRMNLPAQRMGASISNEFSSMMPQHQNPGLAMAAAAATGTPYLGSVFLEQVRAQQLQNQLHQSLGGAGSNTGPSTDIYGLRAASGGVGSTGVSRSDLMGRSATTVSGGGSSSLGHQQQHGPAASRPPGGSSLPMDTTARRLLHSGQITAQQYLDILQNRQTSQDGKSASDDSNMSLRGIRPPGGGA